MRVDEVMNKSVWACRVEEPLSAAARVMWDHDVGAVPVVGPANEVVGIVTDRDLCMAAYFTGRALATVPVSEAMSKVVFTIEPGHSLEAAEELMRSKKIRRLPVVDSAKLVGMISLADVARAFKARKVAATDVTATLAAIVEPRPVVAVAAA